MNSEIWKIAQLLETLNLKALKYPRTNQMTGSLNITANLAFDETIPLE